MAYVPKVWLLGEVIEKVDMDHLEEQYDEAVADLATHAALMTLHNTVVPKTADEIVNNSIALQNDDDLLFAIGTAGTWAFKIVLFFHGAANANIQFAITIPGGGATLCWSDFVTSDDTQDALSSVIITASGGARTILTIGAGEATAQIMVIHGWVKSGGTAGNVQLQWAQGVAQASNTIVMEESYLIAYRLA